MELLYEEIEVAGILTITGRIDAYNFTILDKKISEVLTHQKNILIDMSKVDFIDSTGLGCIVTALKKIREADGMLELCGLQGKAKVVFTITRADKIFTIYEDRQAALTHFHEVH